MNTTIGSMIPTGGSSRQRPVVAAVDLGGLIPLAGHVGAGGTRYFLLIISHLFWAWITVPPCPDLLLIYRKLSADTLHLVRLGPHSDLFG